ncbi:cysteine hydrolase [Streptomyces sp. AcH 505]|uniref:isochorismatase family protein n=1 Tax=Streptomyces sp. AcH 505 TaxID=352211 RepID=UPI0005AB4A93
MKHTSQISPQIIATNIARRGRKRAFEMVSATRTAHLVVDLQNGFVERGAPVEVPAARAIIPNVNRIIQHVRRSGGLNVFLRFTHDPGEPAPWTVPGELRPGKEGEAVRKAFERGANDWQLSDDLDMGADDLVLDKTRYSAFVPGTCELQHVLQERGLDTVVISGVLTNCCCESTARDAMQLNYKVVFVEDANAALTDSAHNGTLDNMAALFADVVSTDELIESLAGERRLAESRAVKP